MNINGSNRDCENCLSRDYIGVSSIGMSLYGCKKRIKECKPGFPIQEKFKVEAKKFDAERAKLESCTGATEKR